jgi:hypothetical protein
LFVLLLTSSNWGIVDSSILLSSPIGQNLCFLSSSFNF